MRGRVGVIRGKCSGAGGGGGNSATGAYPLAEADACCGVLAGVQAAEYCVAGVYASDCAAAADQGVNGRAWENADASRPCDVAKAHSGPVFGVWMGVCMGVKAREWANWGGVTVTAGTTVMPVEEMEKPAQCMVLS